MKRYWSEICAALFLAVVINCFGGVIVYASSAEQQITDQISDSDYTSCFRNGKIVTLVLNIKVLKPLSSFNTYLTLPKQYIPSSVMFVPTMALNTGIRIGTSGEVMPCANIGTGAYIQTAISYVIK